MKESDHEAQANYRSQEKERSRKSKLNEIQISIVDFRLSYDRKIKTRYLCTRRKIKTSRGGALFSRAKGGGRDTPEEVGDGG